MTPEPIAFEQALAELERILRDLEDGDTNLEESLARYERGVALLGQCYGQLKSAEQKVRLLSGLNEDVRLGSVRQEVIAPRRSAARPDALFLKRMVENGMRAQVRTGNLLTGQLYVALDFVPKAARATLDESVDPPTIPSVPGTLSDLQPQIADIISRIGKVRFDEIGAGLQDTLKSASATSGSLRETLASANAAIQQLSPEAQRALAEVRQTLSSAQTTLDSFERNVGQPEAPLQRNANQALAELQRAARALRVLGDYLQQHPESILRGKPADTDPSKSGSR